LIAALFSGEEKMKSCLTFFIGLCIILLFTAAAIHVSQPHQIAVTDYILVEGNSGGDNGDPLPLPPNPPPPPSPSIWA